MKKPENYVQDGGTLKAQLAWRKKCLQHLTPEEYKALSTKKPMMHFYFALRTTVMYFITLHSIIHFQDNMLIWFPLTILQGIWLTNFISLMHESVHGLVWNSRDPGIKTELEFWSRRFYSWFCGTSASFFHEYHGRHHHRFFRGTDDPKSTHFVPKDGGRLAKWFYFGPGLMRIFNVLKKNVIGSLNSDVQRWQKQEQTFNQSCILALALYLNTYYSFGLWFKIWFLPHACFFPIVFMVDRCGQHYCCDPENAPYQSTPTQENFWADVSFHYLAYHVEHHTFAEVPGYNLKAMHRLLRERLYKKEGMGYFTWGKLVWGWLVENRPYYTIWWDMATPY